MARAVDRVWSAGRAYVALVVTAGALSLSMAVATLMADPPGANWWLLVGLTVLSGSAVLRVPATSVNFSISDVFTLTSMVVYGPAAGVVAVAVDCLAISYRLARNRLPVERILFNAAAPPLAMWLAAHLFVAASGIVRTSGNTVDFNRVAPALALAAGAYFLLNTFSVALAIAFHERRGVLAIWKAHFQDLWFSFLGGALGAGFVVFGLQHGTYGTALLSLPLVLAVILHFAYRNATGRIEDQVQHLAEVNRLHLSTVESLAHAIDAKDSVTHNHIRRVQTCALALARQLQLDDEQQLKALEAGALLHDIGKLAVPEHILNKPGPLTPPELEQMKAHARVGAEILSEVAFPYPVVPVVRHHHENWDGTGYPDGLSGNDIPIGARILAVVDCYDALTSDRPYRSALSPAAAFEIIRQRRGTMYDPMVVDALGEIHAALATEGPGELEYAAARLVAHDCIRSQPGRAAVDEGPARFEIAYAVGAAVSSCRPEDIPALVWGQLRRLAKVHAMVVYSVSEREGVLMPLFCAGAAAGGAERLRIAVGERVSGWVAANGQSIVNADARLEFLGLVPAMRSAVAVPIGHAPDTAVLSVYSEMPNAFDAEDLALLQTVASAIRSHVPVLAAGRATRQAERTTYRSTVSGAHHHANADLPAPSPGFRTAPNVRAEPFSWPPRMGGRHPVI